MLRKKIRKERREGKSQVKRILYCPSRRRKFNDLRKKRGGQNIEKRTITMPVESGRKHLGLRGSSCLEVSPLQRGGGSALRGQSHRKNNFYPGQRGGVGGYRRGIKPFLFKRKIEGARGG